MWALPWYQSRRLSVLRQLKSTRTGNIKADLIFELWYFGPEKPATSMGVRLLSSTCILHIALILPYHICTDIYSHALMHFWIKKYIYANTFTFQNCLVICFTKRLKRERLTDPCYVLALGMEMLFHSFGPDPWRCAASKKYHGWGSWSCSVWPHVGAEAGVLCCLSPPGQHLPRAHPVPLFPV